MNYEEIVISALTTPGSHILTRDIADYWDKNPNVNFKIKKINSKENCR
jgi:hypothetical protein